jgi:hypothetical protein
VKAFRVDPVAQDEFGEAAVWYERQREGLGSEFITEINRVLTRIHHEPAFTTAPIATVPNGVVRREFVDRFPYVVVFVETAEVRKVIMIRRGSSHPARWRSRL